jgi:site-specific DNA-methyltransferase (adenine-specific)
MILSENPRIEFTNEDNMELMARYPDKHFKLVIVDPPYGIGEDGEKNHSRDKLAKAKKYTSKNWDSKPPDELFFAELRRISQNQIVWGANHFISQMPFSSPSWIVWDKLNSGDFADCELAWTSHTSAVRKFQFRWNGMLQGNMKEKESRIHPTQKPVALYKWLLQNYAKEGDTILDTHVGSGSIIIACWELGFDFVGCELDNDYYEAAIKRFKEHVQAHPKLFTPKQLTNIQLTLD